MVKLCFVVCVSLCVVVGVVVGVVVCVCDDRRRDTRMCLIARVFPSSE